MLPLAALIVRALYLPSCGAGAPVLLPDLTFKQHIRYTETQTPNPNDVGETSNAHTRHLTPVHLSKLSKRECAAGADADKRHLTCDTVPESSCTNRFHPRADISRSGHITGIPDRTPLSPVRRPSSQDRNFPHAGL
jgi:hypothetical protein